MRYGYLGNTGLLVSQFGFGTWTFGDGPNIIPPVQKVRSQNIADRMVGTALDAGITLFNSADTYAGAEEILGRALGGRRRQAIIATKVGLRQMGAVDGASFLLNGGLSKRHICAAMEGSLRRLGTDYVDIYLAHLPDHFTPLEETLEAFEQLTRQGKVRYTGFSNWPSWMVAVARGIQQRNRFAESSITEMYYSLAGRDLDHDFVPFIRATGIGLMAWSPLAGGFLSGRYTPDSGGRRAPAEGRLSQFTLTPVDPEQGTKIVGVLGEIAGRRNATPSQIALAWLLSRSYVSTVLLGASSEDQLKENIASIAIELTEAELLAIEQISAVPKIYPYSLLDGVAALYSDAERAVRAPTLRRM